MTRASLLAAAAALGAAAAACTNLPDVARGTCGNGVVEPDQGEECDGDATLAGGTCGATGELACHFVCDQGESCPDGYACGGDGRCRAPLAVFSAAPGPYAFDAIDLAAGDVDGDGYADLVGVSSSELEVRFGDADGDLFASASEPIREPIAHSVFGDLDGDGGMDVLIPSSVGIFSFLADGRGFNPFPYTSITLGDLTSPIRMADVEVIADVQSEILTAVGKQLAYIGSKVSTTTCIDGGSPPLCLASTHDAGDLAGDRLATGRTGYQFGGPVPLGQDTTDELALAFKGDDHVTLFSPKQPLLDGDGTPDYGSLQIAVLQTIALPHAGTKNDQVRVASDGDLFFGQFDDDGCTDVLIPVTYTDGAATYEGLAIAYGAKSAGCTGLLEPTATLVSAGAIPAGETTVGLIPRAVADLDGDGLSDVVTNELIAVTSCTRQRTGCAGGVSNVWALDFRAFTPREWTGAVATDLNRDGVYDLAGIEAGHDDVDVLLGAGFGIFNKFTITTDLPPREVRTGDFDGDLYYDVAIVMADTSGATEDDELAVLFGSPGGGFADPVVMGTFGTMEVAEPVSIIPDLESIDAITDLMVVADRNGQRGVAPLLGSSSRRMLAPYLLREGPTTNQDDDSPVAIELGDYDDTAGKDVAALAKLVAKAGPSGSGGTAVDATPRVFLLSGAGDGDLIGGDPAIPAVDPRDFEYRDARWATGPLTAGATRDAVVGIDASDDRRVDTAASQPHVFVATPPTTAGGDWQFATPIALPAPYDAMEVHDVRLADLDGDGADDLLVDLVAPGAVAGGTSAAIVIWNQGGTLVVDQPTSVYPAGPTCHDVVPIQADTDPALELVASCTGAAGGHQLIVLDSDGSSWTTLATVPVSAAGRPVVGDFNGDLLDDIAVTDGGGADATVHVYLQCAVADLQCALAAQTATTTGN
jgi:FG-GAP-like repeat